MAVGQCAPRVPVTTSAVELPVPGKKRETETAGCGSPRQFSYHVGHDGYLRMVGTGRSDDGRRPVAEAVSSSTEKRPTFVPSFASPAPSGTSPDRGTAPSAGFVAAARAWADTPRRLVCAAAAVTLILVASTLLLLFLIASRIDAMRNARDQAGAFVVGAQQVRAALSKADAAAASLVFEHVELDKGGRQEAAARQTYADEARTQDDVDDNLAAAVEGVLRLRQLNPTACPPRAAGPTAPACAGNLLDDLGRQTPVYAGMVERARANNRVGNAVGEAYLRRASELMRTEMIPVTDRLVALGAGELDRAFRQATRGLGELGVTVVLCLSGLVLVVLQVALARFTHRVFNLWLITGSLLLVVVAVWTAWAFSAQQSRLVRARDSGYDVMTMLAQSRVLALQARADENLALVSLGNGRAYDEGFDQAVNALGYDSAGNPRSPRPGKSRGSLTTSLDRLAPGDVPPALTDDLRTWLNTRSKVVELLRKPSEPGGQDSFTEATRLTVGPEADAFDRFDGKLAKLLEKRQSHFESGMSASLSPLNRFKWFAFCIMLLSTTFSLAGLWRLYREYQP